MMRSLFYIVIALVVGCFAVPKPMESIENYNILMVHGAYGASKGFGNAPYVFSSRICDSLLNPVDTLPTWDVLKVIFNEDSILELVNNYVFPEANEDTSFLGEANIGYYGSHGRLTYWLNKNIFEDDSSSKPQTSYTYHWRSFSNPANTSRNNAHELGDRMWNQKNLSFGEGGFGHRRTLMEEAQEVKAVAKNDSGKVYYGQAALDTIRKNPDLYRQLASRYILVGHSMGGVVSREYVQSDYYNGDVDKIITLDSPHEGTGALNMQVTKEARDNLVDNAVGKLAQAAFFSGAVGLSLTLVASNETAIKMAIDLLKWSLVLGEASPFLTRLFPPEVYYKSDPLVGYVDPRKRGENTIYALNQREYDIEKQPMYRILASKYGMTFTDPTPTSGGNEIYRMLVPDFISLPFENSFAQLTGNSEGAVAYVNMKVAFLAGIIGIPMKDNGSSIVPDTSSAAIHVDVLNDSKVDTRREYFNAAPYASGVDGFSLGVLSLAAEAIRALKIIAQFGGLGAAAAETSQIAIAFATAVSLAMDYGIALRAGIPDLTESHTIPLGYDNLDTMKVAQNSFSPIGNGASSYTPYLMEDFLYERPFVNLALNDLHTLDTIQKVGLRADGLFESMRDSLTKLRDSLKKDIDTLLVKRNLLQVEENSVAKLNHNCYYLDSKSSVNCAIGLFGVAKDLNSTLKEQSLSGLTTPLKFHSESDWSKIGVKVDRWEKVPGLKPNGTPDDTIVPIRHVERYEVPAIVVEDFIEKYSFVVDDLMPHRLRQIRMNFNFQEEIAWECDISKDPQADDACKVYKRTGGGNWINPIVVVDSADVNGVRTEIRRDTIDKVPHPVLKNGQFDFNPNDYGYYNKLALQKDNQNTVTISTVNKIGLSNTQRFYYLFKATDNMLQPSWPKRDVVLNKIKGFKAYASALAYQGYTAAGADDIILPQFASDSASPYTRQGMDMFIDWKIDMSRIGQVNVDSTGKAYDKSSAYFASKQENSDPQEGDYLWKFFVDINNIANPDNKDTSNTYEVPFRVDRTAPVFALRAENNFVNPNNDPFVARFTWGDSASTPDIRAMRLTLEQMDLNSAGHPFTQVAEFPAMSDVASPDFAIQWNDTTCRMIEKKGDGFYRIKAYAVDYAVPDSAVFNKMDSLVTAIMMHPNRVKPSLWPTAADSVNSTTVYDTFFVDTKAPVMSDETLKGFSTGSSEYSKLSHPARKSGYAYATEDSLLEISYKITEPLNGRDSVPVTIAWQFIHAEDTTKADRAGDSLWIKNGDAAHGSWTEMAGLRLSDGDYKIRAIVRDQARNEAFYNFSKNLRVDKTAPNIESLVSTQLVYPDSVKNYSAKIVVNENSDIALNRTGMHCHYHVGGCGKETPWKRITDKVLKNDSVTFKLDSLDGRRGKCYLEVACIDAAGNVSLKTDLFYIGERTPVISSPRDSVDYNLLVAISGIAPPVKLADSSNTIYRLRYASVDSRNLNGSLVWETSNIFVVSALRDSSHRNISKTSQSNDAVLGYLDRKVGKDSLLEGTFIIELGVCAGVNCIGGPDSLWKVDTSYVFLGDERDEFFGDSLKWHFVKNRDTLRVGVDSLEMSLYRSGMFNSSYFLRVYAEDAKHVGMFDESVSKAWRNPYYGAPKDTMSDSSAVWFYELDGKYHLQWNGLGANDSLVVSYDSAGFGKTCESVNKGSYAKCTVRPIGYNLTSLSSFVGSYFDDFPELSPLSTVNHEMLVTGKSGHIVMTATEAFRLSRANVYADTTLPKMHVYFGENDSDGFYWIAEGRVSSDTLNPLMMGWTVNPRAYGLTFVWNGSPETGMYPATGKMKIYAEATENISSSPHVFLDSMEVEVRLPNVKIALAKNLPDFILSKNESALICESPTTPKDSCEEMVLKLNAMIAKYGIKYRDAHVGIYVMRGSTEIAKLQDPASVMRANANDSAYQVRWDGKGKQGMPQFTEGDYTLLIIATPVDGSKADEARASFHVKYAETMKDVSPKDPKNLKDSVPAIFISEAKPDSANAGMYRYEPIADYLVKANASGWMFPDSSLVSGVPLVGKISGTQQIYKYEPKRFSLALKRHRKELKLVVLAMLDVHREQMTQVIGSYCKSANQRSDTIIYSKILSYDSENLSDSLHIYHHAYIPGTLLGQPIQFKYGYDNNKDYLTHIDVIVLMERTLNDQLKGRDISLLNAKDFKNLKQSTEVIWKLSDYLDSDGANGWNIPKPDGNAVHDTSIVTSKNENCSVVYADSAFADTSCAYGVDTLKNTPNYNPNANLFNVDIYRVSDYFYKNYGTINDGCNEERWREMDFYVKLTIPNSYWNAPFGMDNLVNRTVRFDHTNKTIFGDGNNGYWNALQGNSNTRNDAMTGSYYDGNKWKYDRTYGLLTPFEVQYLPMYPASLLDGGLNTFLFADEDAQHMQSARFDMQFFTPKDEQDYFKAVAVNSSIDSSGCDTMLTNVGFMRSTSYGRKCVASATSNDSAVKSTPFYLKGQSVEFYVGRNMAISRAKTDTSRNVDTVAYPATLNWRTQVTDSCVASGQKWDFASNGSTACYKYYDLASRIHYYYGDFTDSVWTLNFVRSDGFIKNMVNTPAIAVEKPLEGLFKDSLDISKFGKDSVEISVVPSSQNYDKANHRFVVKVDTVTKMLGILARDHVVASIDSLDVDSTKVTHRGFAITLSSRKDTLYVLADSVGYDIVYRKSEDTDTTVKVPVRPNKAKLPINNILAADSHYINYNQWVKNVVVNSAVLQQLDSSDHTHLKISGNYPDSVDMYVEFRPADSINVKRPKELVEIRAYLKDGVNYQLAYLNGNAFYAVPNSMLEPRWKDSIKVDSKGWYRLGWFDVNKLQGNTQFMLLWGDKNKTSYNFAKFDMIVGRSVDVSDYKTVKSLFEEVSVTFPKNSVDTVKDVTVRTIDAKDYSFEVFNNLALKGPIVEILPHMIFADSVRPRIQVKISYDEMKAMRATPQTVRLYKVDTTGKRFVPLQNTLYGFLKADGSAVMEGADTLKCDDLNKMTKVRCAGDNIAWAYLFISAETQTFSVFTAMDSAIAETPNFSVTILPEIASTANRTVRVDGISRYRLYVDDDSLWNNRGDATPPGTLAFTADSNGFAQIALPSRGSAVDTSYVFVVALSELDSSGVSEELPAAPAVARALTVNTQFACSVPSDSLWLGLDNGYMAYGASCTHPGYGLVTLYRNGRVAAEIRGEIPDTVIYDGSKTSGEPRIGKIDKGVYESRYVGVSILGMDMQKAGPRVYTDSARPVIRNFDLRDSSEVLDRIFTVSAKVTDSESGVARVIATPVFGDDTLRVINLQPDSAGHVSASVRISRKQLAECSGCNLALNMRVEDYGHNFAEQKSVSEKLYPYPTELALWYPARESGGNYAHEFLGTGHDLELSNMGSPWGSDVGLYFGNRLDRAVGSGIVDLGSTSSYSFEARVKPGNPNDNAWHEILTFKGVNSLDIRLLQNKRALKLVENMRGWETGSILPPINKSWVHVVVTVDSAHVKFYVDGEMKAEKTSGVSQERELEGQFSMGKTGSESSYIGNIADIRMYSRALSAVEAEELSKPVTDAGEVSDVIVVAVKDLDAVSGISNEFSCSVAGNKYLVSSDSAILTMSVIVENAADYNVVLYARSAVAGDKLVHVGESNLLTGTASVSNIWRAVTVSGVSVHLAAGTHTLTLKVPAGIQIGGVALTTANIPASMIAWGASASDKVVGIVLVDTARKVKSYLRYEGYPETSTLRPRIRLRNISNEPVNGFAVRYYFRGEDASQAGTERYWPNYVATSPSVHSESAYIGYVEWKFTETIPVAGTVFNGDGPHFGLFNSGNEPWDATDDPSFVDPNSGMVANIDGFYEDAGVVVLDLENNLIGGSCAEMEDPVSLETKVRVLAADMRGNNQASEIHFKVENTGNVVLKNFDVRYYFFVEEGLAPDYEINDKSKCTSASMESLGSGRWQVTVHCDSSLAAGKTWQNPVKVALHLSGWANMWNANDDPSHDSLGTTLRVARGICVFDSTGYMIYGNTPIWALPAPDEVNPEPAYHVDFGYHAPGNTIPVIRTPEGLVITMDNWSYVELSLVTALGTPVKFIFSGTLAPGDQIVRVDWTGIDMNRTYLMLKVNGAIKSTKKLSLL